MLPMSNDFGKVNGSARKRFDLPARKENVSTSYIANVMALNFYSSLPFASLLTSGKVRRTYVCSDFR